MKLNFQLRDAAIAALVLVFAKQLFFDATTTTERIARAEARADSITNQLGRASDFIEYLDNQLSDTQVELSDLRLKDSITIAQNHADLKHYIERKTARNQNTFKQ